MVQYALESVAVLWRLRSYRDIIIIIIIIITNTNTYLFVLYHHIHIIITLNCIFYNKNPSLNKQTSADNKDL